LRFACAAVNVALGNATFWVLIMTAKIEIDMSAAARPEDDSKPARQSWVKPEYQKFAVRGSETANTNSNFDGTNYSS
jgi:hypothetical protein